MYADGGGLYLQVTVGSDDTPRKSWLFRYSVAGRERQMGLGPLGDVPLSEARDRASAAREMRRAGKDPIVEREALRAESNLAAAKSMSFDDCAKAYIAAHRAGWRNVKHADQWSATVRTYCSPVFGRLPVQLVDVGLVMKAIEPIWATKPETASRVRGRIERILDWSKVRGHRDGENPARWRGHLDHLLPVRSKVRRVKHHASLPYAELPAFMVALRERDAVAARALEFAILTAARTSEVLGAKWSELDLDARLWTVPAERMKAGKTHRVPLGDRATEIVRNMMIQGQQYVFYGDRRAALSDMSLLMLLRRMKRQDITSHGFRSTFRTWAAERTSFPREVVEAALAHTVGNKVEAAYQRGDMLDKRRRLMDAWTDFCNNSIPKPKVVPLIRKA
jgi:integrase